MRSSRRLSTCASTDLSSADTASSRMSSRGSSAEPARDVDALALAAGNLVRIAPGKTRRLKPDAMQQVVGARDRRPPRHAMHARAECDGVLDRQARIERRVAVLEHHLDLFAEVVQAKRGRADLLAVEQDVARVGLDDLHDQAARWSTCRSRIRRRCRAFRPSSTSKSTPSTARTTVLVRASSPLLLPKCLTRPRTERRAVAPPPRSTSRDRFHGVDNDVHCLTSMADRSPSENRLKEIEVMKIIAPGSAATIGWV